MFRKMVTASLAVICSLSFTLGASAESASKVQPGKIVWPESQALPSFAKPKHLQVADIYDAPGDIKLLLATLQGIVNRAEPRIYLLENIEEGKYTWLNDLKVPYTEHASYWSLVERFKDEVSGVIVYDPEVPDSINVATTLAGIKGAVVASPELAEVLTESPY